MHLKVTRVASRGRVYQYAQLVESYRREDGVSTQRVLASLGPRDDLEIANLKQALAASRDGKAVVVAAPVQQSPQVEVLGNLAWLDVAVVVEMLRRLDVRGILQETLPRSATEVSDADVVLALVAQRCVDPDSKWAAVDWFAGTALPELLELPASRFNNSRIHRVLEGLEAADEALQTRLANAVSAHRGAFSVIYLDLTDTWFVGRGPPLAVPGKTKEGLYRRKIGIALLCDEIGLPLRWKVVEGTQHDSGPMKDIAMSLQAVQWARGVPMVMDRAMGATAHLEELLASGRPFVTALCRNEFDAYTDALPCAPLQDLPWSETDSARNAAKAVLGAGMVRVSDDLFVLDLGVVTRTEAPRPVPRAATAGKDKCRERLAIATRIRTALDSGQAATLAAAAAAEGFSESLASQATRLLRLAPDIQSCIAAGEASGLSIKDLQALTHLSDPNEQRQAWRSAVASAQARPDGRRSRKAGKLTAAPQEPAPPSEPPQLRAVVAFNPEQWVRQKRNFEELFGELVAWADRKNRAARESSSQATAARLRMSAHARLERKHMVQACTVSITHVQVDGRDVPQVHIAPDPVAFRKRQRFFGFQVIVGRPDEVCDADELVAKYRAKDKVEKGFQTIKSVLSLRPVRHRTDVKLRAHVTLCMLALLVERLLDHALLGHSSGAVALDRLSEVHLNRIRTGPSGRPLYTITRPRAEHLATLRLLELSHLVDDARMTAALRHR